MLLHCSGLNIEFTNTVQSESLQWCNMIVKGAVFGVALAQFYCPLTFKLPSFVALQELRESVQLLLTTKIAVYLMTFLIVTVAWAAHIRWALLLLFAVVWSLFLISRRSGWSYDFCFFCSQTFSSDWTHRWLPCSPQSGLYHISDISLCSGSIVWDCEVFKLIFFLILGAFFKDMLSIDKLRPSPCNWKLPLLIFFFYI